MSATVVGFSCFCGSATRAAAGSSNSVDVGRAGPFALTHAIIITSDATIGFDTVPERTRARAPAGEPVPHRRPRGMITAARPRARPVDIEGAPR